MKRNEPTGIGDILDGLKKTTGLGAQLERAAIWERWPEVVGKRLSGHGRPRTVKDKTLVIEADSPVWVHRYAFRKWHIIGQINRFAGREIISDAFICLADDEDPCPTQDGV